MKNNFIMVVAPPHVDTLSFLNEHFNDDELDENYHEYVSYHDSVTELAGKYSKNIRDVLAQDYRAVQKNFEDNLSWNKNANVLVDGDFYTAEKRTQFLKSHANGRYKIALVYKLPDIVTWANNWVNDPLYKEQSQITYIFSTYKEPTISEGFDALVYVDSKDDVSFLKLIKDVNKAL